jgi:hypothetical protein
MLWGICAVFLGFMTLIHLSTKETVSLLLCVLILVSGRDFNVSGLLRRLLIVLVVGVPLVLLTPIGDLLRSQFFNYFTADAYESQTRTALTVTSFFVANDYFPLGSGSGSFASPPSFQMGYSDIYYQYGLSSIWGASEDHPEFLTDVFWPKILGQTGWIGILVYLVFFWKVFGPSIKGFFQKKEKEFWLCGSVSVSGLLFSIASTPYTQEFMLFVSAFFAAYAACFYVPPGREALGRRSPGISGR